MENYAQGIRTELKKVRSPQDNSLIRNCINNIRVSGQSRQMLNMRVDFG